MQYRIKAFFESMCGILLLIAVFINVLEIPLRVLLGYSYDLLFDFPVWFTMWSLMLITGFLLTDKEHISIDFLRNKIHGYPRLVLEIFLALITLIYGLAITYGATLFVWDMKNRGVVFPRIISVPQWIIQLCIPVGMGIFTIFACIDLIHLFKKNNSEVHNGDL